MFSWNKKNINVDTAVTWSYDRFRLVFCSFHSNYKVYLYKQVFSYPSWRNKLLFTACNP